MADRFVIVAMGVSGSGKTTFGKALAAKLDVCFEEGDDLHPPSNIAKMRRGTPLDDSDRAPWLDAVAVWIASYRDVGGVISCSALKRSYRDRLRAAGGTGLRFVLLDVPAADLRQRLAVRQDHFMPPSLLASQLDTLERPVAEADAFIVDGTPAIDTEVEQVTKWLSKPRTLKPIGPRS